MLRAKVVETENELEAIFLLNRKNLKKGLRPEEQSAEGFLTWLYSPELLRQMHELAPSIIIKDGEKVAAYALTTLPEARAFHPDLNAMFQHLEELSYKGQPLFSYRFYCMGQICVDKPYRGQGLVQELYSKHREEYHTRYELLLTEISTSNPRSQKAHEKVGFSTIHTYKDALDEWNVVVWQW
jgi:GNAT superfamily N-acetyltransferase